MSKKIQDYLNTLQIRTDSDGHIVRSPLLVRASGTATCMEGALLAASLLKKQGARPLLLDLKVGHRNTKDVDHVVALFQKNGAWGALSMTGHSVLRYRDPIYKSVRELAMSYFHEYFTDDGKKNLRSFSKPFDVDKHAPKNWETTEEDLFEVAVALDDAQHEMILTKEMEHSLRKADPIEIRAGNVH